MQRYFADVWIRGIQHNYLDNSFSLARLCGSVHLHCSCRLEWSCASSSVLSSSASDKLFTLLLSLLTSNRPSSSCLACSYPASCSGRVFRSYPPYQLTHPITLYIGHSLCKPSGCYPFLAMCPTFPHATTPLYSASYSYTSTVFVVPHFAFGYCVARLKIVPVFQ
jgi:hypothetical protein